MRSLFELEVVVPNHQWIATLSTSHSRGSLTAPESAVVSKECGQGASSGSITVISKRLRGDPILPVRLLKYWGLRCEGFGF